MAKRNKYSVLAVLVIPNYGRRNHVRHRDCDDGESCRIPALKDGVFAHPTLAESLNNLFMAMDDGK